MFPLKSQYQNQNMHQQIKPKKMLCLRFQPLLISQNMKSRANRYYLSPLLCTRVARIHSKSKIHHSQPSNIIAKQCDTTRIIYHAWILVSSILAHKLAQLILIVMNSLPLNSLPLRSRKRTRDSQSFRQNIWTLTASRSFSSLTVRLNVLSVISKSRRLILEKNNLIFWTPLSISQNSRVWEQK